MVTRVLLPAVALMAAFASPAVAQTSSLMGSISYPEQVGKSRTAILEVTLEDVSAGDGTAVVVASSRMVRPGPSPVMFSLPYDGRVVPANRYAVRARIIDGAATLFTSIRPVRVLTQGYGSFFALSLTTPEAMPAAVATAEPTPARAEPAHAPAPKPAAITESPAAVPAPVKPETPPSPLPVAAPVVTRPVVTPAVAPPPVTGAPASSAAADVTRIAASAPTVSAASQPKPAVSKPAASKPAASAPAVAAPAASKPATSKPAAPAPVVTAPAASKPAASVPVVTAPGASKPATSAPVVTAPAASKPAVSATTPSAPVVKSPPKPTTTPAPATVPKSAPVSSSAHLATNAPASAPPAPIAELPATFTGTLPCGDCPGIRYELTLASDATYAVKKTFEGSDRVQLEAGSWDYSSDRVVLVLKSSHDAWSWFAVRPDHVLRAVDSRGQSIGLRAPVDLRRSSAVSSTVATASRAAAATTAPVTTALADALWTLTELGSKPVRPSSKTHRAIVIAFDATTRKFSGVTGCNVLEGEFNASWRTLTLTPTLPLPVCRIDQGTERAVSRTIKATRAYRITGTTLDLFDEAGARIARLEGIRR